MAQKEIIRVKYESDDKKWVATGRDVKQMFATGETLLVEYREGGEVKTDYATDLSGETVLINTRPFLVP